MTHLKKLRPYVKGLCVLLLIVVFGRLAVDLRIRTGIFPIVWPPTGIALAALVLTDIVLWPWIFLAGLCLYGTLGYSVPVTLLLSIIGTLEGVFGAYFLKKYASSKVTFSRLKEVALFALLVMGLTSCVGVSLKVAGLYLLGGIPNGDTFVTWRSWWLGEGMSNLIIGAVVIAWVNDLRFRIQKFWPKRYEGLLLLAAITTVCIFNFTPLAQHNDSLVVRPYFLFSLMLWATIRFDTLGAFTLNTVVALIATIGTMDGFLPFPNTPTVDKLILLQFFIGTIGTTSWVLAATIKEKDEAVEARSEFLAVASHELKTPITSLNLQLQLSQRKLNALTTDTSISKEEQVLFFGKVEKQVRRLISIVEQLLDVSRFDSKFMTLHFEKTNPSELARKIAERLSNDLNRAHCNLHISTLGEFECLWDSFRIEQVLENLLSNAIKYAPGTSINLKVEGRSESVLIDIQDQGPGIAKSRQPFIFDRFVRANASNYVDGLGLGLFITREIVLAHGGSIKVRSEEGRGSLFSLVIPKYPDRTQVAVLGR